MPPTEPASDTSSDWYYPEWRAAALHAPVFRVRDYVGAGWLRRIPTAALARIICALLVFLGVVLLIEAALPLVPAGVLPGDPPLRIGAGVAFGLVIGAISSLLGVAGEVTISRIVE